MDNWVEIRLFAAARAAAGVDQIFCPSAQFEEIIRELCRTKPALAPVIAQCSFLLDSVAVHDRNFVVHDGSVIDVLPRFAGG
jgi:molybdopterin converting factor small subunit